MSSDNDNIHQIYRDIFPDGMMYIGQTIADLDTRWVKGYTGTYNMEIQIAKYGKYNPDIVKETLIANLNQKDANYWEKYYIAYYNKLYPGCVLNFQEGGLYGRKAIRQFSYDGEYIATYESIEDAANKTGINISNISACLTRSNYLTAGGFRWYYDNGKTYPIIQYRHHNVFPKAVEQIDPETNTVIAVYESARQASRETGIDSSHICGCANNKRGLAGGFKWRKCEK